VHVVIILQLLIQMLETERTIIKTEFVAQAVPYSPVRDDSGSASLTHRQQAPAWTLYFSCCCCVRESLGLIKLMFSVSPKGP
jgi:hypothetical protein